MSNRDLSRVAKRVARSMDRQAERPLYAQIYAALRAAILSGELATGSRLPASRQLARALAVARVTVVQAYDQLSVEGYVETRRGAGTFVRIGPVAAKAPIAAPAPGTTWAERLPALAGGRRDPAASGSGQIDFGFGRPFGQIFPFSVWRQLLARYLSSDDMILARYGSPAGFLPLREAVATYLRHWRGVRCSSDDVVIVSGVQQALDILARLLLVSGDPVYVESPGYRDAHTLFRLHGARLTGFNVDDAGFPTQQLPATAAPRLIFVTPANQFPRGGTMPLDRRLSLLQWAASRPTYVIEDDYDGELRYQGRPIASLQGLDEADRVIYLGSFSKVLFPALRLGYVVLPERLRQPFVQAKAVTDRGAPTLTQAAVADFIGEGFFERHLRRLRQAYGVRRTALTDAIDRHLGEAVHYVREPAGLHVMLTLQQKRDEAALIRAAAGVGVNIYPGAPYFLQKPVETSILLGFSGLDVQQIQDGVSRLGSLIKM